MKYFKNIESLEDLKTQYKKLAKKNHPDVGGDLEAMQAINVEFDMMFAVWQNTGSQTDIQQEEKETAESFARWFYTQNGWQGSRYNANLSCKEIGKLLKTFCKTVYPNCKFSITTTYNTIHINLMECNYDVFANEDDKYNHYYDGKTEYTAHMQLNQYQLINDKRLTEKAQLMFSTIANYLNTYNYDDSDSMIDYFDTNFYERFSVGDWNKPFKVVVKTERIETEQIAADIKPDNYTYDVKEDIDTRDNSKIFVVNILEKLSKDEYINVSKIMKKLGGYYSKFKHGFLFKEYPAELFS